MSDKPPLVTDDLKSLPPEIREALSAPELTDLFKQYRYYEDIRDFRTLRPAIELIAKYAQENGLVVYHCTKELFPGKFAAEGLRVLDQQKHVDEFLRYVEKMSLLDERERTEIEPKLRTWMDGAGHMEGREGTLHLLHAREEVSSWGGQKIFQYYGGEALHWPFGAWRPDADHWFLRLLESIGEPVVVEAKVCPSDLITGSGNSGADILIFYFARSVNPDFEPSHLLCYTEKPIAPEQIMSVTLLESFIERFNLEVYWE